MKDCPYTVRDSRSTVLLCTIAGGENCAFQKYCAYEKRYENTMTAERCVRRREYEENLRGEDGSI